MASLQKHITAFLQHCQFERNFSTHTLKAYRLDLAHFQRFTNLNNHAGGMETVTRMLIKGYVQTLSSYEPRTQRRRTASLRSCFRYLEAEGFIQENPMASLKISVRIGRVLPRTVGLDTLNGLFEKVHAEGRAVSRHGRAGHRALRDVAVFELMFCSGMRVSEISNLTLGAVDLTRSTVLVRGKGGKERLIPLCGEQVCSALRQYADLRATLPHVSPFFFLNRLGRRLSEQSIRFALARFAKVAGIGKITPHVFRHTVATMLLEQGVDLRFIQILLGHSSIVTTTIYAHVNQKSHREVLAKHHPRRLMADAVA